MLEKLARSAPPALLAPVLLLLSTGFTECESFTDVTVPDSDTDKPTTFDGVWIGGQYVQSAFTGSSFVYHAEPGENVLTIAAAVDRGGLKRLEVHSGWRRTCCSSTVCSISSPLTSPRVELQEGTVGSTVSDGIWVYEAVQVPTCGEGWKLTFGYSWFTEAEDFHGNITFGNYQSIVYP
jgi:hypothetical protein